MSSLLEWLPTEVEACILDHLDREDLVTLHCTSKRLYNLIFPLLWTEIELHRPGLHEQLLYKEAYDYDTIFNQESKRRYIGWSTESACEFNRIDNAHTEMSSCFLAKFSPLIHANSGLMNMAHLIMAAESLRSLCMDIAPNFQNCLLVFSQFQNLKSLEISFRWTYNGYDWDENNEIFLSKREEVEPLKELCVLRLRGYVPVAFAQWACYATRSLVDLELAILDRPIGTTLLDPRENPPPRRQTRSDRADEGDNSVSNSDYGPEESDSEPEDMDQEMFAPRPLAVFLDTDIPERFTSISTLTLRRPAKSSQRENDTYAWTTPYTSVRSDETALAEWARILRSVRSTVEHLIFDQRPIAEIIETDSTGDSEYVIVYQFGSGYQRFKQIVLPVLLEDVEWPRLKSIRLYGFDTPEHANRTVPASCPKIFDSQSFFPQLEEKFRPFGVDVNIGLGRRMLFEDDTGEIVTGGDGFGKDDFHDSDENCCPR